MAKQAYEEAVQAVSFDANVDLSETGLSRFVKLVNDGGVAKIALADTGGEADGVLLTKPIEDQPGRVGVSGIVPVEAGGAITAGAKVEVGAGGTAVTAAGSEPVAGKALATAAAAGEIIPVLLKLQS